MYYCFDFVNLSVSCANVLNSIKIEDSNVLFLLRIDGKKHKEWTINRFLVGLLTQMSKQQMKPFTKVTTATKVIESQDTQT